MRALLGAAVLLALALCVPIRVCARYGEEGASLETSILRIPLRLPGQKPPKKKAAKREPRQKKETEAANRPGSVAEYRRLLAIMGELLGKLRTRLSVDELTFRYLSAGDDPARAALLFGAVNAAAGLLLQPLEAMFRIRKRDVQTAISFQEQKPKVYVCLRVSVSIGTLLWLFLGAAGKAQARKQSESAQDTEV